MTRDAQLYYLWYQDWNPIQEAIEASPQSYSLMQDIVVFRYGNAQSNCFAILSVNDKIDKIIEQNGGIKADEKDLYRNELKRSGVQKEILFGEESLSAFIVPIP